jgi:hypothetical protein
MSTDHITHPSKFIDEKTVETDVFNIILIPSDDFVNSEHYQSRKSVVEKWVKLYNYKMVISDNDGWSIFADDPTLTHIDVVVSFQDLVATNREWIDDAFDHMYMAKVKTTTSDITDLSLAVDAVYEMMEQIPYGMEKRNG